MTKEVIAELWQRLHGLSEEDEESSFWRTFAATCLSDTSISAILEESPIEKLAICETNRGLSVIERLLIARECEYVLILGMMLH
jgi:hypothetical protein